VAIPITEDDVRAVVGGANRYEQLTKEDGTIGSDSTLFDAMAPAATAIAEGILMIGFDSVDRVRALIGSDASVKMNNARICAGLMGATKLDMYSAEKQTYPYQLIETLGRDELDRLARAQVQSPAQQDNPAVGQHDRTKSGNVNGPQLTPKLFNPDCPGQYGKGGF
jgi:hypothetical protein